MLFAMAVAMACGRGWDGSVAFWFKGEERHTSTMTSTMTCHQLRHEQRATPSKDIKHDLPTVALGKDFLAHLAHPLKHHSKQTSNKRISCMKRGTDVAAFECKFAQKLAQKPRRVSDLVEMLPHPKVTLS